MFRFSSLHLGGAVAAGALALGVLACGSSEGDTLALGAGALQAQCVDAAADLPTGAWACGTSTTVECRSPAGTPAPDVYVIADQGGLAVCGGERFTPRATGPFPLGTTEIVVDRTTTATAPVEQCRATLRVVDTRPPRTSTRTVSLWPPNHKRHRVAIEDCVEVEDDCDDDVDIWFTWVRSDEPVNANGDGNTDPDVTIGCDAVELRAERQGGSNGRVYTLGWRARDGEGNEAEGSCRAVVAHDQSGRGAVEDARAYELAAPASCTPGS